MAQEIDHDFVKLSTTGEDVVISSDTTAAEHSVGVEDVPETEKHDIHASDLIASVKPVPVKEEVNEQGGGASCISAACHTCSWEKSCCNVVYSIDPKVIDLLLWRDVKKTGVTLASLVVLLLSLSLFSVLSVFAYFGLVALTISVSFRLYSSVMGMINKTTEVFSPFKQYLECDLTIPEDKVRQQADTIAKLLTKSAESLRRLFLVENVVNSLKFGLILWLLTYVGSWFNGLTVVLLITIELFTLPKVYVTYKVQIDQTAELAMSKIGEVWQKVEAKLPMIAKKKLA